MNIFIIYSYIKAFSQQLFYDIHNRTITQIVCPFFKAQSKIQDFDTKKYTSLQPWLQRIARNWALDEIRKQGNQSLYLEELDKNNQNTKSIGFDPVDSEHAGPVTKLNSLDEKQVVVEALNQLSTKSEIILRSHDGEKKSVPRIAQENQLTIDKVKYRLGKARIKLKALLLRKDL